MSVPGTSQRAELKSSAACEMQNELLLRKTQVWQESIKLAASVLEICAGVDFEIAKSLCSSVNEVSRSISLLINTDRKTVYEEGREEVFLRAAGALVKLENQIGLAENLHILKQRKMNLIRERAARVREKLFLLGRA